jgi:hypothetical protein
MDTLAPDSPEKAVSSHLPDDGYNLTEGLGIKTGEQPGFDSKKMYLCFTTPLPEIRWQGWPLPQLPWPAVVVPNQGTAALSVLR